MPLGGITQKSLGPLKCIFCEHVQHMYHMYTCTKFCADPLSKCLDILLIVEKLFSWWCKTRNQKINIVIRIYSGI